MLIFTALAFLTPVTNVLFSLFSGLAVGFAVPLVDALVGNMRYLRLALYSLRTWNQRVRISIAYLYRIEVDGEYLLIRGHRFGHFQPVGGVYKTHPSSAGERDRMGVLNDSLLQPDPVSEGDLRVRVPGRQLVAFIKWFESERGRETDGWREFYEELIASGILPSQGFRHVAYDRVARIHRPLRYSAWAQSQELLIADIFVLLPTPQQLEELRNLKTRSHPDVLWATEGQIRRRGAVERANVQSTSISETASWTIDPTEAGA